jgi:hypothetical protein
MAVGGAADNSSSNGYFNNSVASSCAVKASCNSNGIESSVRDKSSVQLQRQNMEPSVRNKFLIAVNR